MSHILEIYIYKHIILYVLKADMSVVKESAATFSRRKKKSFGYDGLAASNPIQVATRGWHLNVRKCLNFTTKWSWLRFQIDCEQFIFVLSKIFQKIRYVIAHNTTALTLGKQ